MCKQNLSEPFTILKPPMNFNAVQKRRRSGFVGSKCSVRKGGRGARACIQNYWFGTSHCFCNPFVCQSFINFMVTQDGATVWAPDGLLPFLWTKREGKHANPPKVIHLMSKASLMSGFQKLLLNTKCCNANTFGWERKNCDWCLLFCIVSP